MKRAAVFFLLLSTVSAFAQCVHRNDIILNKQQKAVAGAKVYFCQQPASGAPCTNPITLYTNLTCTVPLGQSYVVTDANGNFDVYAESQWVTTQVVYGYAIPLVSTDYGLFVVGTPLDFSFDLLTPQLADSGTFQHALNQKTAFARVYCSTDTGTASINIDVRAPSTPNTSGTSALASPIACNTTMTVSTTFATGVIAANSPLALLVSATSGSPGIVRVHVSLVAQ